MFDIEAILILLVGKFPFLAGVLVILGLLVVVAQVLVAISPTKKDDAILERLKAMAIVGPIITALTAFAPIQPKPPKL